MPPWYTLFFVSEPPSGFPNLYEILDITPPCVLHHNIVKFFPIRRGKFSHIKACATIRVSYLIPLKLVQKGYKSFVARPPRPPAVIMANATVLLDFIKFTVLSRISLASSLFQSFILSENALIYRQAHNHKN